MYIEKHIVQFATTDVPSHVDCWHFTLLKINMTKDELKAVGYDFVPIDSMREKAQNFEHRKRGICSRTLNPFLDANYATPRRTYSYIS